MEVNWGEEHEKLLCGWADKAMCYKWLHMKSTEWYHFLHNIYTIPVIIMSTLTGTANFAQEKLQPQYLFYAPIVIGCINILAGIITTIQQFLHITELYESHRVSTLAWDKFYRRIKTELSKKPAERTPVKEFIFTATDEYDRLVESSPTIDNRILKMFDKTFKSDALGELSKPEILDTLIPVKQSIYIKNDPNPVEDFIINFKKEFSRQPTKEECITNLSLPNDTNIDKYLRKL